MLIPREYFTLNEVLADWGISESELGYVVEMGQLSLSVRIYGAFSVADGKDWLVIDLVWEGGGAVKVTKRLSLRRSE